MSNMSMSMSVYSMVTNKPVSSMKTMSSVVTMSTVKSVKTMSSMNSMKTMSTVKSVYSMSMSVSMMYWVCYSVGCWVGVGMMLWGDVAAMSMSVGCRMAWAATAN